jgi:hypothetical protein
VDPLYREPATYSSLALASPLQHDAEPHPPAFIEYGGIVSR